MTYYIWAGGNFIMMLLMSITLIYFPEALLLTTNQLMNATRLYKFVSLPIGNTETSVFGDYRARVAAYIQSLPEEILVEAGIIAD